MTQVNTGLTSENGKGPGAVLRQAREERRLSIDDVARSLNLTPQRIQALEGDAFERLPGPTYVRGYLRSYGQLLGLAVQPLLDLYNSRPEAAQRNELVAPAPSDGVANDDVLVKVGVIGIAAVVIGLGLLWWSGNRGADEPAVERTASVAPTTEPLPAVDAPSTAPAPSSAPELQTNRDASSGAPAAADTATAAASDPSVARATLVLRLREDSWADVRDAQDNRLLYQTLSAGRVVSVQGVPPLSVFLGNVDGVDVDFNGRPYDATRHQRGEVARFTLGTAAANP